MTTAPRYFLLTGGSSVEDLLDRASARGEVRAARAHGSPASAQVVYGAVEIIPCRELGGACECSSEGPCALGYRR